jgi:hypothetical protein
MAIIVFTSVLALIALAIAVVPVSVILLAEHRAGRPAGFDVAAEARRVLDASDAGLVGAR